ncbi:MAG: DUF6807 family protein [Verrucomicrobiales bacterium]
MALCPQYPRGRLHFPLTGPSGEPLTRMGHPGAENHDHHRSVWFAHNKLNGLDFWSEQGTGRSASCTGTLSGWE